MVTLINTNRMTPPIGPIGLDYIAPAVRAAGFRAEVLDLCLADDPRQVLDRHFAATDCRLVGVSFRNVDDSYWPSAEWFVPQLGEIVALIKNKTRAPVVLGGVGFSILPEQILRLSGADFGIRGDGELALPALAAELRRGGRFENIPGLVWRQGGTIRSNPVAWPPSISLATGRDAIDNKAYFELGGQCGLETKRGCNQPCIYCADPLAKGTCVRTRHPAEVADEVQSLLAKGIDVFHLCDCEFNIPGEHARAVCEELTRCGLGKRIRWYAYMSVVPFDAQLARAMRYAGCVGVDFGADSVRESMLRTYRRPHRKEDVAAAVRLCRDNGITVMLDLLLAGPGETPETLAETISFVKQINPDCAGAALGVRVYPGTVMHALVTAEGPPDNNPNLHRKYTGPVDFARPMFYISAALGQDPAGLVRQLIGADERFFAPEPAFGLESAPSQPTRDHNYNRNQQLIDAIKAGARGAYWDILRMARLS